MDNDLREGDFMKVCLKKTDECGNYKMFFLVLLLYHVMREHQHR